ncbi:MAG: ATP-binding protein [Oscillospiraceae bacterium]|nr:ATP-binding protein [Oscillospiraceae bacterium]
MNTDFEKYKELHTKADLSLLPEISQFVKSAFQEFGVPVKVCRQMDIVVEELFTNVASYAYPPDAPENPVDISCGLQDNYLYLIFSDKGVPYNPLKKEDPVIGIAEEMTIGGYGIFMVKSIMDELEYQYVYEEGRNILRMRKKF